MIWGLRAAFAFLLALAGRHVLILWWKNEYGDTSSPPWYWDSLAGLLISGVFITLEIAFTRRFIAIISAVLFGVLFGFIASYLFVQTLFLLPAVNESPSWFKEWVQYGSMAIFVYLAVIGILASKDDFKFVIPFVELAREHSGPKPILLDTSVIIDGRVADMIDLKILAGQIIVPRFVLQELQSIADSQDKLKRNRGRRGLDILNRIQKSRGAMIEIYDAKLPSVEGVDAKLVTLAKHLNGRVMTNDFNLNKVAQLQGVDVINIHDLATAMRPVLLPGESMEVKMQKPGEEHGQGVGYLEDGTMVVVEGGYHKIGQVVAINVTSVLQTSAGRMIFGTLKGQSQPPSTRKKETAVLRVETKPSDTPAAVKGSDGAGAGDKQGKA